MIIHVLDEPFMNKDVLLLKEELSKNYTLMSIIKIYLK